MPTIRYQVTVPYDTGVPEDITVNTWHFWFPTTTDPLLNQMVVNLRNFYQLIGVHFANYVDLGLATVKAYDLSQPKPRPPVLEGPLGTTETVGSTSQPPQVAIVMSMHSQQIAGVPMQRCRNRIYFGPMASQVVTHGRPAPTIIADIVAAANNLLSGSQVDETWNWVTHSQFEGLAIPGAPPVGHPIIGGYVDDTFDVQRRRGWPTGTRTTFGAPSARVSVQTLPAATFGAPTSDPGA